MAHLTLTEALDAMIAKRYTSPTEVIPDIDQVEKALIRHRQENRQLAEDIRFLKESGLLFELNRQVLHPYGLALTIEAKSATEVGPDARFIPLTRTEDPEGIHFYGAGEAVRALERFKFANRHRLEARQKALGEVIQSDASCLEE